jgi:hypothetical protein
MYASLNESQLTIPAQWQTRVKENDAYPASTSLHRTHRHHQQHLDKGHVDIPSILPEAFGSSCLCTITLLDCGAVVVDDNLTIAELCIKNEDPA